MAHETPTDESKAEQEKYEAERDVRTLVDAANIRDDAKRLKRAMEMARKQLTVLKQVQA